MKKIWKKWLLYGICILLALFYLLVLWWGKNPQVGTEYRMYYLTHELSDWPGYGKLSYELGTKEYCTSLKDENGTYYSYKVCQTKGQGWAKEQYHGSTSKGTTSWIYFRPTESAPQGAVLNLEISGFTGNGTVAVYAGEQQVGTFTNEGSYTFDVTGVQAEDLLTIRFEEQDCTFTLWSIQISGRSE